MAHTVVIAGVGPGLGASIARKFATEGCDVGLLARSAEFIEEFGEVAIAERLRRPLRAGGVD